MTDCVVKFSQLHGQRIWSSSWETGSLSFKMINAFYFYFKILLRYDASSLLSKKICLY